MADRQDGGELELMRAEFDFLRRQLAEVLLKSERLNEELLRIEMTAASMLSGGAGAKEGEEYRRLVESYVALSNAADKIISKALDLNSFSGELLGKEKLEDIDRVRLRCKIDELVSETENLRRLLSSPRGGKIPEECAISAVSEELQVAVLDAGSADNIICGLIGTAEAPGGRKTVLKVIALRPFVAAAVVVEGDIMDLLPGMKVKIGNKDGN